MVIYIRPEFPQERVSIDTRCARGLRLIKFIGQLVTLGVCVTRVFNVAHGLAQFCSKVLTPFYKISEVAFTSRISHGGRG